MTDDQDAPRSRARRERQDYAVQPAPHVRPPDETDQGDWQPKSRREARAAWRAGGQDAVPPAQTDSSPVVPVASSPVASSPVASSPLASEPVAPASPAEAQPDAQPEVVDQEPARAPAPARGAAGLVKDGDGSLRFSLKPGDLPDARASSLERLAVVLAVVAPPIGLALGVTSAGASRRRRGWVSRISVIAIALAVVMIGVWIVGGLGVGVAIKAQQRHDTKAIAARSFCAAIRAGKLDVNDSGFGWPAQQATVDDSLTAMRGFVASWTAVEKVAPSDIRSAVAGVVRTGTALEQAAQTSRQINIDSDLDNWAAIHSASTLPAYVNAYCR